MIYFVCCTIKTIKGITKLLVSCENHRLKMYIRTLLHDFKRCFWEITQQIQRCGCFILFCFVFFFIFLKTYFLIFLFAVWFDCKIMYFTSPVCNIVVNINNYQSYHDDLHSNGSSCCQCFVTVMKNMLAISLIFFGFILALDGREYGRRRQRLPSGNVTTSNGLGRILIFTCLLTQLFARYKYVIMHEIISPAVNDKKTPNPSL